MLEREGGGLWFQGRVWGALMGSQPQPQSRVGQQPGRWCLHRSQTPAMAPSVPSPVATQPPPQTNYPTLTVTVHREGVAGP